jgi:signal transduction histidine kinase
MKLLQLILCILISSVFVYGNVESSKEKPHSFASKYNLSYLTSHKNQYTLLEVMALDEKEYTLNKEELLFFNEKDYLEDIWLRIDLSYTEIDDEQYIIEVNNPLIDYVYIYYIQDGIVIDSMISGDMVKLDRRKVRHRNPTMTFSLDKDIKQQQIYIYLNASGRKIHVPFTIKPINQHIRDSSTKDLKLGLYVGILILITLFNLYMGIILIDKTFFIFAIYMLFLTFTQLCTTGLAYVYLWPNLNYWNNRSIPIFMGLALIFGVLFVGSFVTRKKLSKKLSYVVKTCIALMIIVTILALGPDKWLYASMWLLYRLIPLLYLLMLAIGAYYLFNQVKTTRLFVPGFIAAAIALISMVVFSQNQISDNVFTNDFVLIAVGSKCIILTMALLDRLRIYKHENEIAQKKIISELENVNAYKEELNRDLEYKIKKKSEELLAKNNEIQLALIKGEEKERKRIAQELHDGMGSLLSTLRLNAESIDINSKNLTHREMLAYKNLLSLIDKACDELRTISHNMLPSSIEHFGLKSTLTSMINELRNKSETSFELDIFDLEKLKSKEIELHLYRIVLELINNIIKHSSASIATVQISANESMITLIVSDNGVGMQHTTDHSNGIGIISLKSRLQALKGHMNIDSKIGYGTTSIIEIPNN